VNKAKSARDFEIGGKKTPNIEARKSAIRRFLLALR
jgi:hypothetical protein